MPASAIYHFLCCVDLTSEMLLNNNINSNNNNNNNNNNSNNNNNNNNNNNQLKIITISFDHSSLTLLYGNLTNNKLTLNLKHPKILKLIYLNHKYFFRKQFE